MADGARPQPHCLGRPRRGGRTSLPRREPVPVSTRREKLGLLVLAALGPGVLAVGVALGAFELFTRDFVEPRPELYAAAAGAMPAVLVALVLEVRLVELPTYPTVWHMAIAASMTAAVVLLIGEFAALLALTSCEYEQVPVLADGGDRYAGTTNTLLCGGLGTTIIVIISLTWGFLTIVATGVLAAVRPSVRVTQP